MNARIYDVISKRISKDRIKGAKHVLRLAEGLKGIYPEEEYNELMKRGITWCDYKYRYPDEHSEQLLYQGEIIATFTR